MKKVLMSFGAITMSTAPIAMVVSCNNGDSNKSDESNFEGYKNAIGLKINYIDSNGKDQVWNDTDMVALRDYSIHQLVVHEYSLKNIAQLELEMHFLNNNQQSSDNCIVTKVSWIY